MTELEDKARELTRYMRRGEDFGERAAVAGMRYAASACEDIANMKDTPGEIIDEIHARFGANEKPEGTPQLEPTVKTEPGPTLAPPAPPSSRAALVEKAETYCANHGASLNRSALAPLLADFAAAHAAELQQDNDALRLVAAQDSRVLEQRAKELARNADTIAALTEALAELRTEHEVLHAETVRLRAERDRAHDEAIEAACCAMTEKHSGWRNDWVAEACQIVRALRRGGEEQARVAQRKQSAEAPVQAAANVAARNPAQDSEVGGSSPSPSSSERAAMVERARACLREHAIPEHYRMVVADFALAETIAALAAPPDPFEAAVIEWEGMSMLSRTTACALLMRRFGPWREALEQAERALRAECHNAAQSAAYCAIRRALAGGGP